MDLELQEVAGLLQVSEEQLLKWVSEGKIPAYFINDHYRFNRQEIEAWVMRQKQNPESVTQDDTHKLAGSMRFNLFRALNNGDVFSDISVEFSRSVRSLLDRHPYASMLAWSSCLEKKFSLYSIVMSLITSVSTKALQSMTLLSANW